MPRVIILGCGFLGEAAADFFYAAGWQVLGICGSAGSAARLAGKPYEVRPLDVSREFPGDPVWRGGDALIHCASTRGGDADAYRAVYLDGLLNAITAFQPRRTLFTSSTSVYAQIDGSWVDESSETAPEREAGKILLDAEGVSLAAGGYVARLAGLYGPGRSMLREKFLSGGAVLEGDGERWINLIHRDDAVAAIGRLFLERSATGIYNVADDTPVTQRQLFGWLAEATGGAMPKAAEENRERKRAWTSKRVSNAKLRATGWTPRYASYREALSSPDAI